VFIYNHTSAGAAKSEAAEVISMAAHPR
jgi:hypothetical protein